MAQYVCKVCGYVYDPAENDGVAFEDLDDSYVCPLCGVGKDEFDLSVRNGALFVAVARKRNVGIDVFRRGVVGRVRLGRAGNNFAFLVSIRFQHQLGGQEGDGIVF